MNVQCIENGQGKVVKVFVEKAEDGTYWGTAQNVPGAVTAYGNYWKN